MENDKLRSELELVIQDSEADQRTLARLETLADAEKDAGKQTTQRVHDLEEALSMARTHFDSQETVIAKLTAERDALKHTLQVFFFFFFFF